MKRSLRISFCSILGLTVASCGSLKKDDDENKKETSASSEMADAVEDELVEADNRKKDLELQLSGLSELNGSHYEGWLIVDEKPVSSGRFNIFGSDNVVAVDREGMIESVLGKIDSVNFPVGKSAEDVTAFVLTIEPDGDKEDGPSDVHLVAGDFEGGRAYATTDHPAALGTDFADVAGSYILATPSEGEETATQGIWWLDPNSGPSASLELPELPKGWKYEGWVVDTAGTLPNPISTGTFRAAEGEDSDSAGATAGSNGSPPFPGQDFINPSRQLNNGSYVAVISVEPDPDFDMGPFAIKVLKSAIPRDLEAKTSTKMDKISQETLPMIKATIE